MLIAMPIWGLGVFYLLLAFSEPIWWLTPLGSFLIVAGVVVNALVFRAWRNSPRLPEKDDGAVHDEKSDD